jgi:hypothetical protein
MIARAPLLAKRLTVLLTHSLTLCQYDEQKHMTTASNFQEVH